ASVIAIPVATAAGSAIAVPVAAAPFAATGPVPALIIASFFASAAIPSVIPFTAVVTAIARVRAFMRAWMSGRAGSMMAPGFILATEGRGMRSAAERPGTGIFRAEFLLHLRRIRFLIKLRH